MSNLLLLIACFAAGFVLKKTNRIPENASKTLNSFILHISLPAQILFYIHGIELKKEFILPAGMAWIIFVSSVSFFILLAKILDLKKSVTGCLLLLGGLGNTSFLGLPMIETYFGKEGIPSGILCDQPGTFLVLSILGIPLAITYSSGKPDFKELFKKILLFPPFQAFILAIFINSLTYPDWLTPLLKRLGDTLAPLALFSVGFQFDPKSIRNNKSALFLGLSYKMVLAPALIYLLYFIVLGNESLPIKISVFEAAMPPMITAGIVASEHNLEPELASTLIATGILISFPSLFLWQSLLQN